MDIGRKIYYELATGNAIQDTGERQGDVIETTTDQDFQLYSALQPYQQSAVGCLQLTYGQDVQNFGKYPYHVDTTTKAIVWDTSNPIGASLADVQNAKESQLTDFQNQANKTFQSSALGTVHTYIVDMGSLDGEFTRINSTLYDNQPILWYTLEEGGVNHTKDQFNQVWLDGHKQLSDNFAKWDSLVKQVKACTTVDQVNAINW